MNPTEFCYWLQGYFELEDSTKPLGREQVRVIRNHLALVFHYSIDPEAGGNPEELQHLHDHGSGGWGSGSSAWMRASSSLA